MAIGTAPPPAPAPRRSSAEDEQLDRFIAERIGRTRNEVRLVEVFAGMMAWLAAVLACLMVLVVCDHWLISGGLGFWPRVLALGTMLVGSVVYGYRRIAPWMSGRINPVYAAQAIEQSRPGLKNSLINFLLLRPERSDLPAGVYQALEQRAASDLSHVPAEGTVDRTHLVRISYFLLAVVVICCLYKLLSPKDPLTSVARLLVPWSSWNAPTRVSIADVEPGDTRAFHDDFVEVSAVVRGVRRGESVTLFYSTEDGQTVDQAIEMTLPADSYRYRATLPAGAKGLQQTVSYYLAAGDARSASHRVEVQTAPAILVQQVDYDYPAYTGLADRSVQRQGDVRAIQGTQVTIIAAANRDIAKADLDFDCDGTSDLKMKVEGRQAVASFALNLGKDNKPEHASYQLRFTDPDGKNNPQPIRHRVEVQADEPPQVEIVQPTEGETQLAANGVLLMAVRARDPDFALRTVTLLAERGGERIVEEQLLSVPHTGEFRGTYLFDAAQQKLKPGQEVLYWAEARDSRQPVANSTVTNKFKLQIVAETTADERRTQRAVADQAQRDMQDQPEPGNLPNDAGDPTAANDKAQRRDRDATDDSHGADDANAADADANPADATAERGQPPAENSDQPDTADEPERRDPNEPGQQQEDAGRDEQSKPGEQEQSQQGQGEKGQGEQGQGDQGQGDKGKGEKGQGDKGRPGDDKANDSAGDKQNGGDKQKSGDKQSGDDRSDSANENSADQKSGGKKGGGEKQSGRQERIDPEANPGEAFEKLLKRAQEQQSKAGQSKPDQQQPGSNSSPEQQQRQQPQPNKDQSPSRQPNERPTADASGRDQSPQVERNPSTSPENSKDPRDGQQSGDPNDSARDRADQQQSEKDQRPQDGKQPPGEQSAGDEGQSGQKNPAGQQGGQSGKKQAGQGQKGGTDKPQSDSDPDAANEGESGREDSPGADKKQGQGSPAGGRQPPQPGKKPPGGGQEKLADDQSPDDQPAEGETDVDGQGQGAKQPAQDQNRDAKQGQRPPNQQDEGEKPAGKQGGKPPQNQGQPGAGQQDSDSSSGPGKEQSSRDRPKNQGAGNPSNQQDKGGEPPSPSDSKSESDSQGSEGGDRSGGGKKGGGQQSQQAGKGAPGSSTESDEGAAAKGGNEQGQAGESSSDGKQGAGQGGKPAPGSGQSASGGKPAAGGEPGSSGQASGQAPASGQNGAGSTGGSPAQGSPQGAAGQKSNDARPGDKQGNQGPGGGGEPAPGSDASGAAPPAAQRGDEPNVEYARRATDLVLDYLKNKRNSAGQDQALRDLNWSPADLQKFIDRWERMKAEAQQPGEAGQEAQKRLDDALRGLGLVPEQTRLEASTRKESGARSVGPTRRSEPPSEYADQFRAYTRGAARQPAAKPAAKKP